MKKIVKWRTVNQGVEGPVLCYSDAPLSGWQPAFPHLLGAAAAKGPQLSLSLPVSLMQGHTNFPGASAFNDWLMLGCKGLGLVGGNSERSSQLQSS